MVPPSFIAPEAILRILVWDLPTRLFHWLLVATVATCATTAFLLPSRWLGWHFAAGYVLGGLLLFRLSWAFFGPEPSRWPGFIPTPAAVIAHLKAVLRGHPPATVGHNPAGGAMILALLLVLSGLVITGLVSVGGLFKQGPLAFATPFHFAAGVKEIHELLAYGLLALAGGHILGVLVESKLLKEALILTMITGKKDLHPGQLRPAPRRPMAFAVAGLLLLLGLGGGWALSDLPKLGWHPLEVPAVYAKECGACHMAYHPSLMPAAAWSSVMGHLSDHFGEDASLPAEPTAAIAAWLQQNAGENWDSLAANRLQAPLDDRITGNSWWKRKHRHIPDTVFQQKSVKSRSNCNACHGDAAQGLFAPQSIALPQP